VKAGERFRCAPLQELLFRCEARGDVLDLLERRVPRGGYAFECGSASLRVVGSKIRQEIVPFLHGATPSGESPAQIVEPIEE
jgi:hypothetical protein